MRATKKAHVHCATAMCCTEGAFRTVPFINIERIDVNLWFVAYYIIQFIWANAQNPQTSSLFVCEIFYVLSA